MRFQEREITLKDGRKCILRPNSSEYAAQMLDYLKETPAETDFLLRYPDEVKWTLEEEQKILDGLLENQYAIMMVAIVDGKVAGNAGVNGIGYQRKLWHRCSLAIALYKEYWGLGIGTAMLEYLTELAKQVGWTQIDLEVVEGNERALATYKKCGFVETGVRHHALRFDDGTYRDEILMYKNLT
ncbi:MAG: GNAT family N-acetyltransferase [Saccharofermentans sp.]|nr:GNAT family N-acetyltransferase [Saccharofermentans sp.]